jgi:hypothetical protein
MEIAAFVLLVLVIFAALAGDPVWALAVKLRHRRLDSPLDVVEPARQHAARPPARAARPMHHPHSAHPAHRRVRSERKPEFARHR